MGVFKKLSQFLGNLRKKPLPAGRPMADRLREASEPRRTIPQQRRLDRDQERQRETNREEERHQIKAGKEREQLLKDPVNRFVQQAEKITNGRDFSSSNVQWCQYEIERNTLTISFQDGSVYEYYGVFPQEAKSLFQSRSKGTWVWDNLRIRGTVYGHRKQYTQIQNPRKGPRWYGKDAKAVNPYIALRLRQSGGKMNQQEKSTPFTNKGRRIHPPKTRKA